MSNDFEGKHPRNKTGQFVDKHVSRAPNIELGARDVSEEQRFEELYEKHGRDPYDGALDFYALGGYDSAEDNPCDAILTFADQGKSNWLFPHWTNDGKSLEISGRSPAGEEVVFEFEPEDGESELETAERLVKELRDYADVFDADEHAKMWHGANRGEPQSLQDLLSDAEVQKEIFTDFADRAELALLRWKEYYRKDENTEVYIDMDEEGYGNISVKTVEGVHNCNGWVPNMEAPGGAEEDTVRWLQQLLRTDDD